MAWPEWGDVLPLLTVLIGIAVAWLRFSDRTVSRAVEKAGRQTQEAMDRLYERLRNNDFQHVEAKIQSVENKIQSVETGIQGVETRIQGVEIKIQSVEAKIQHVETKAHDERQAMEARLNERMGRMEVRLDGRMERIEKLLLATLPTPESPPVVDT